jgi:hypothetical protein
MEAGLSAPQVSVANIAPRGADGPASSQAKARLALRRENLVFRRTDVDTGRAPAEGW